MTTEAGGLLILLTLSWPVLLVLGLSVPFTRRLALRSAPSAAVPALLTALLPWSDTEIQLPWLLLGSILGLDELSRTFLLFSSLLWIAGGLTVPEEKRLRFTAWYLITMAGNFGVLLAREIPSFFTAYAMMSIAAFGLIIHQEHRAARRAANLYLFFAVLGEMLLLSALLIVAYNTSMLEIEHVVDRSPQGLLLALLLLGFGIKAGVPLLHIYLPPVYAVVPLAAAVPMSGALLHLGLYGWMRFLPMGYAPLPEWAIVFIAIGTIAIFLGVFFGLIQKQAKALLAYSSISQMGLMTTGIGIALVTPEQWPQISAILTLFALHHAIAKGTLFHGLGISGHARIGLWLPALALAGLPFTGGALVKGLMAEQIALLPKGWGDVLGIILPSASIATALLMARFLYLAVERSESDARTSTVAWWFLLGAGLLLPWLWPLPLHRTSPIWAAIWPVLIAAIPAWLVFRHKPQLLASWKPPADLLAPFIRTLLRLTRPQTTHRSHGEENVTSLRHKTAFQTRLVSAEALVAHWPVALALLLSMILALALLSAT